MDTEGARSIILDLTKEPAELTVADHRECPHRRASISRKESESEHRGSGQEADPAIHVEIAQIVARNPFPAEDQIVAHIHIHRRHRQYLVERVAEAEVDSPHWCRKSERFPLACRHDRNRTRLAQGAELERGGQARTDEAVCGAGVDEGDYLPRTLCRRKETRQSGLELGVVPPSPPGQELG